MRKLSKKISMLMVLAMLVSLFSGVVSASAASSWSFYNKTKGDSIEAQLKNETYEMESGEFADFDMFKDGKTIDTDVYTVKYESSDADVVWVDAKNGKLRADKAGKAEVGDTAKITANIENKDTGAKAKRWFVIEIVEAAEEVEYKLAVNFGDETLAVGQKYELEAVVTADGEEVEADVVYTVDGKEVTELLFDKAGEYTVVVTATIDGEVVVSDDIAVVADEFNNFEIAQKSMNTFTMTFADGKDLSKVTKDDVIVMQAASIDGVQIKQFVNKVSAKDNVLTVTLYNDMSKDSYVFAKFAGEEEAFQVVKGDVASVEVVPGKVEINKVTALNIKLYDQFGIDITTDALLQKVTVEEVAGGENANIESGRSILFWVEGKSTIVKATYHTYTYKDGKEVTYVSNEAEITSVKDTTTYSNITDWVVTTETNKDKVKWTGNNKVAIGDEDYYAIGKIIKTTGAVNAKNDTIITYGQGLTFESSDNTVLIVMANGELLPISEGSADIIVKQNKEIKGVFTVEVVAKRKATTMSLTPSKNTISANDSIEVKLDVKDQYGDSFKATASNVTIKDLANNNYTLANNDGTYIVTEDNKVTFKGAINGSATADTKAFYRSIKVGDAVAYFEFTVKKVDGEAKTFAFAQDSLELDTTIASNNGKTFAALYGDKTIAVKGYDKNGMMTSGSETILGKLDASAVAKAVTGIAPGFYITINAPSTPNNTAKTWATNKVSVGAEGVTFQFVDASGAKLAKAPAGTYVINLYKAVESYTVDATPYYVYNFCDSIPVTVKDSQKAYTVEVKAIKTDEFASEVIAVSGGDAVLVEAVKDVFKISYNGSEITNYGAITADASHDFVTGYDKTIIFKKVKIDTTFTFNGGSETKTLEETITFPTISVTGK